MSEIFYWMPNELKPPSFVSWFWNLNPDAGHDDPGTHGPFDTLAEAKADLARERSRKAYRSGATTEARNRRYFDGGKRIAPAS